MYSFLALFALSSDVVHLVNYVELRLTSWPGGSGPMEQEVRACELKQLLTQAAKLTSAQREQVLAYLGTGLALDRATAIVDNRWLLCPGCPKCQSQRVVCNGQADGLQRYKCRTCERTFNALTGTLLARLRQRDKWIAQAQAINDGFSIRKAAAVMGCIEPRRFAGATAFWQFRARSWPTIWWGWPRPTRPMCCVRTRANAASCRPRPGEPVQGTFPFRQSRVCHRAQGGGGTRSATSRGARRGERFSLTTMGRFPRKSGVTQQQCFRGQSTVCVKGNELRQSCPLRYKLCGLGSLNLTPMRQPCSPTTSTTLKRSSPKHGLNLGRCAHAASWSARQGVLRTGDTP
jgi:transposase-like protein